MHLYVLTILFTYLFMEFVAWFTHKYLMHGILWFLHHDHHNKDKGIFEKNDSFFLIFAIPAWLFIMLGMMQANWLAVSVGIGISLYGLTYFLLHDVYIHGRFFNLSKFNIPFLNTIKQAHIRHHKNVHKEEGVHFGLLLSMLEVGLKNKN